jgi:hypothetical protein
MDIMTTLGGRQVFGSGTRQIDLINEVERGLPTKAYNAVAKARRLKKIGPRRGRSQASFESTRR